MKRYVLAIVLSAALSLIGATTHALYDLQFINNNLQNGVGTAMWIDDKCQDAFRVRPNDGVTSTTGYTFGGTNELGKLIDGVYGSNGDGWQAWLSLRGRPSTVIPDTTQYGTTSLDLQINGFRMLCPHYTLPDIAPRTNSTSAGMIYNAYPGRKSTATDPRDALPQPIGRGWYGHNKIRDRLVVTNIVIDCDAVGANTACPTGPVFGTGPSPLMPNGTITPTSGELNIATSSTSRFSFASPINATYLTPAAPITTTRTLRMTLQYYDVGYFQNSAASPIVPACSYKSNGAVQNLPDDSLATITNLCALQNTPMLLVITPAGGVYDLYPKVALGSSSIQTSANVTASGTSANISGGSTSSPDKQWTVARFELPSGRDYAPQNRTYIDSDQTACAVYSGQINCNDDIQNGTQAFPSGATLTLRNFSDSVDTIAPGSRVCYVTTIRLPTPSAAPLYRHSAPACATVAKTPSTAITGGDVMAGRPDNSIASPASYTAGVYTLTNTNSGSIYGSWAEYGITASDRIQSVSGGVLARPGGRTGTNPTNALTFANNPSSGYFMQPLANRQNLTSLGTGAGWSTVAGGTDINLAGTATMTRYIVRSTAVHGDIGAGHSVVVAGSGTVRISGNITYTGGPYTQARDLPQAIIIADNIIVDDSVTRIDAWLVTRDGGTISTCGAVGRPRYTQGLSTAVCNAPLRINGPVNTGHLQLRRTAGGEGSDDASLGRNAENINLRADTYLWSYGQAQRNSTIRTTHVTELAPRF